jgi:hypothetical protein
MYVYVGRKEGRWKCIKAAGQGRRTPVGNDTAGWYKNVGGGGHGCLETLSKNNTAAADIYAEQQSLFYVKQYMMLLR